MTEQIWKYHTPQYDGHAPDDWVEGMEVEFKQYDYWYSISRSNWRDGTPYRYRPLQDATVEPDLLAQCLALPKEEQQRLIEAMQKPVRDWADEVWDKTISAHFNSHGDGEKAAAVIRSMCRPKEEQGA